MAFSTTKGSLFFLLVVSGMIPFTEHHSNNFSKNDETQLKKTLFENGGLGLMFNIGS